MTEKKSYFISLDKERIDDISIPDTTEYEVLLTNEELEVIRQLIRDNDHRDFWYAMKNITFTSFNEEEVDDMRQEDDDNLMKTYKLIYQYGTEETKQKLRDMGFTDREYK